MTRQEQISAGFLLLANLVKVANNERGDLSQLTTTNRNSLVESLNETLAAVNSMVSSMIDDTAPASDKLYSSQRTEAYVNTQIGSAIMAALEGQDLSDIAASVASLAQADNGLISALADQMFTDAQKIQARNNIEAASQAALNQLVLSSGLDRADIDALQLALSNIQESVDLVPFLSTLIENEQQARIDADTAVLMAVGDTGHDFVAEINAILQG